MWPEDYYEFLGVRRDASADEILTAYREQVRDCLGGVNLPAEQFDRWLRALRTAYETLADPNSYGSRKERSTADAIEQCHVVLSNRGGARWVLEGDIKSRFDRIGHQWLLVHIPMNKTILQKWLKAGFLEKQVLHATEEGTPQGGICSPALANLTLDGLERRLRGRYPKATTLSRKAKVNLVRYADDFIITGSSKELLETEVKPMVESFLKERGLELTDLRHVLDDAGLAQVAQPLVEHGRRDAAAAGL